MNRSTIELDYEVAAEECIVQLPADQTESQTAANCDAQNGLSSARPVGRIDGLVLGKVSACSPESGVCVTFPQNPTSQPIPAQSLVAISDCQIGQQIVLGFQEGDWQRPIVLGFLHGVADASPSKEASSAQASDQAKPSINLAIDDERLELRADREIVLRCGKSSLTLTRAGKILIRGAYVLSRSSGVNRIKGGSVQIN